MKYLLILAAPLAFPAAPVAAQQYGVNLSGCEFADDGALCPNNADIDWYVNRAGFRLLRIPVKGKQLLDPAIRARLAAVTAYAQKKPGVEVIIDRHDYRAPDPVNDIALWKTVLPSFSQVTLIDMMNEPVKGYANRKAPWAEWAVGTRAVIAGIRAAGFKHRLLAEWPGYSANFRFVHAAAALDKLGGFGDPIKQTYLSTHRYLDKGSSGSSRTCGQGGGKPTGTLSYFAQLARERGLKAYVTEAAFGSYAGVNASCIRPATKFMTDLKTNSDVLLGVTWWGGGRAWPEKYIFKVEPLKGTREIAPISDYLRQLTLGLSSGH